MTLLDNFIDDMEQLLILNSITACEIQEDMKCSNVRNIGLGTQY